MDLRPANCFLTTMVELSEDDFHLEDVPCGSQEEFIRTTVETRMVQRLYTLKLGDFGHCVRKEDVRLMDEGRLILFWFCRIFVLHFFSCRGNQILRSGVD